MHNKIEFEKTKMNDIRQIDVLDHGYVWLENWFGREDTIIKIARHCTQSSGTEESDNKLLKHLIKNQHSSVFEHVVFRFKVKCPIFVARQWMRHRIGSYTELSRRHYKGEADVYIPNTEGVINKMIHDSVQHYYDMIQIGYKSEIARMMLPVSTYTVFYWTVNLRSILNFLQQRLDKHAQSEMQDYAKAVHECVKYVLPKFMEIYEMERNNDRRC